ncbi:hypothetical protein [Chitiniphilus eburneus]|uniref:Uncharacterized protein n=1 Tax=Chitiniphilus eburneus TaxID=2571148 RepID=A0A4U0PFI5_9NEIS|nr:hypothetical protein [Chitiniphilus eburneus]TJZ66671.1 hypothetical protein FAZ21_17225 [Chitiniphilus eburneus]
MPNDRNLLVATIEREAMGRQKLNRPCSPRLGTSVAVGALFGFLLSLCIPTTSHYAPWLLIALLGIGLWRQARRTNALVRLLKRKGVFEI